MPQSDLVSEIPSISGAIRTKKLGDPELNSLIFKEGEKNELSYNTTGAQSIVYHASTQGKQVVVKFLSAEDKNREKIYAELQQYIALHVDMHQHFVTAKYYASGVSIYGEWLPAVVMPVVHGKTLSEEITKYVRERNGKRLGELARKLCSLASFLSKKGVVHRDIHPNNIYFEPKTGNLVLIDYDDVYIKGHVEFDAKVLGHPEYQHPKKIDEKIVFGEYLDNFPFGVIYIQLCMLGSLMNYPGFDTNNFDVDGPILLSSEDFRNINPKTNKTWARFMDHPSLEVRMWVAVLVNDLLGNDSLAAIRPLDASSYNSLKNRYAESSFVPNRLTWYDPNTRNFFLRERK